MPALSCDPSFFDGVRPDYIPANAAAEQVLIDRAKAYAAGCEQRYGWLLPYLTTVSMARDMDQIRQAFGVQKINYYAFSYGTYLGQVYGTLFPGRVRRMVLDSTVDPTGAWYAGQHRPGLRLPGPARRVLRVDRQVRLRLPPGQHHGAGSGGLLPGARAAGEDPGRRAERPADRPGRARRHVPDRRLPERRVARVRRRRSRSTSNSGDSSGLVNQYQECGTHAARTSSRSTTRSSAPT